MTYAVFILKAGSWELHMTSSHKSECDVEAKYLVEQLGVVAKVFKK